jgi:hypothetical protein
LSSLSSTIITVFGISHHGARRAAYPDFGQRTLAPIHYESANKRPIRAREEQTDNYFQEMIKIADEPLKDNVEAARARNRIDVRKFAVARLAPKNTAIA